MENKEQIFTLWDNFGKVDYATTKYIGRNFRTFDEYVETVEEYLNIPQGELLQNVERFIKENLISESPCELGITYVDVTYPLNTDSSVNMNLMYNGIGGGLSLSYRYTMDPNFECPEDYDEEIEYDEQCHDDFCLMGAKRRTLREVKDKFGLNIGRISSESEQRYQDYIKKTGE